MEKIFYDSGNVTECRLRTANIADPSSDFVENLEIYGRSTRPEVTARKKERNFQCSEIKASVTDRTRLLCEQKQKLSWMHQETIQKFA